LQYEFIVKIAARLAASFLQTATPETAESDGEIESGNRIGAKSQATKKNAWRQAAAE
jgi:hypothetical protein